MNWFTCGSSRQNETSGISEETKKAIEALLESLER